MELVLRKVIKREFRLLSSTAEMPLRGIFFELATEKDAYKPKLMVYEFLPEGKKYLGRMYWFYLSKGLLDCDDIGFWDQSLVLPLEDILDESVSPYESVTLDDIVESSEQLYMSKRLYNAILQDRVKDNPWYENEEAKRDSDEVDERYLRQEIREEFNKEWEKLTLW